LKFFPKYRNVFTGSFYSEVEPELAKARADIVVTQEAQDKAEAASTAARAVEKQVRWPMCCYVVLLTCVLV